MSRLTLLGWLLLVVQIPSVSTLWADEFTIDNGILKLVDDISVPAEVSGTIDEMLVNQGQQVSAGAVLVKIRSKSVQLLVQAAKIELDTAERRAKNEIDILEAEKSAAVAKAELDRVVLANAKTPNTFLEGEVDRYRLMHQRAELGVRRAEHEQELAKLAVQQARGKLDAAMETLSHYQIIAPCSGMVVAVSAHTGEWVEPGQTVTQIVGTSRLRIDGFVEIANASLDLIDKRVEIQFAAFEGEKIEGRVTFVSPEVNPVDDTARVIVEFKNPRQRLRAGSKVSARITLLDRGGDR